jgi:hypothetical protein
MYDAVTVRIELLLNEGRGLAAYYHIGRRMFYLGMPFPNNEGGGIWERQNRGWLAAALDTYGA